MKSLPLKNDASPLRRITYLFEVDSTHIRRKSFREDDPFLMRQSENLFNGPSLCKQAFNALIQDYVFTCLPSVQWYEIVLHLRSGLFSKKDYMCSISFEQNINSAENTINIQLTFTIFCQSNNL